jgi:uncharacterized protein YpbB
LKQFSKQVLKHIEELQSDKKVKAYIEELGELDALFFKQLQLISKADAMVKTATENMEFSKSKINISEENKERISELAEIKTEPKDKKRDRKKKSENKTEKINTKEISYKLFKEGKTIEEIALERKMVSMTIEGHLAHYVSLGLLNISTFVEKQKMENIIAVSKTLGTSLFGPIKQSLGEEYTYSEIRFAMAYYSNSKK